MCARTTSLIPVVTSIKMTELNFLFVCLEINYQKTSLYLEEKKCCLKGKVAVGSESLLSLFP